jgi:hypothetical protein
MSEEEKRKKYSKNNFAYGVSFLGCKRRSLLIINCTTAGEDVFESMRTESMRTESRVKQEGPNPSHPLDRPKKVYLAFFQYDQVHEKNE